MARPVDPTLRARLLGAATTLFADHGFADVGMAAVGEAARVTKGGVYFHFRTKEELFFGVVDHWRSVLRGALPAVETAGPSGRVALEATVATWLRFHFEHPGAARVLRVLAAELRGRFTARLREDARAEQRGLRARLRDALNRGTHDGSLDVGDPALAAFLLVAAVEGIVTQWLTAPTDAEPFCDPEHLAESVCATWGTGAAGRPQPRDAGPGADFHPTI